MSWTSRACAVLLMAAPAAAAAQGPAAIEQTELKALSIWQVGAPAPGEDTLPQSLWAASEAARLGALFDRVQRPLSSPAANRLARAALLAPAEAPLGDGPALSEAGRKRFAALGALSAAEALASMVSAAPEARANPDILTFALQADLARGRTPDACRRAEEVVDPRPYVLRLRAFCFALAKEADAADLAMEVARVGGAGDPWLSGLLPVLAGAAKPGTSAAKFDSSLNAAVSVHAGLKPGPKPLARSSAMAVSVVAHAPNAAPALRAEAVEIALRGAFIRPEAAKAGLEPAFGLKPVKGQPPPPRLAGAWLQVQSAQGAPARALAIETALTGASSYADFVATARLLAADIEALPREVSTAPAAFVLARACLALGEGRRAADWRNLINKGPTPPPEAQRAALDMALVASGQGGANTASVAMERRIGLAAGPAQARAARDVVLLRALGAPENPRAATFLAAAPAAPKTPLDPGLATELAEAAQAGKVGETALLAALVVAPGAHTLDPAGLARVVAALKAVKLDAFATAIAVEAMIGDGVS